jgi:Tannase and feruloyl esterase
MLPRRDVMITRTLLSISLLAAPLAAATCDSLAALKLADTTITSATTIAAGAFTLPADPPPTPSLASSFKKLPDFCRVEGVIQPSSDSHIEFEVWLPAFGWNGKYHGEGNGGFAGSINYTALADSVMSGYASSSTDTGHKGGATDGRWALNHPEKIVDYGYRAIHETAEKSKAIVRAFYEEDVKHSYFSSCSNGGRQALMEAQRYPADYDGIIAGAPAASFTHIVASFTWDVQADEADPASYIPASKYPAIEAAAVAACDARDGVKDGVIDDPTKCDFKPATLLCNGAESAACLTQPQVTAVEKIYAGPRSSRGEQVYPGFLPGGESGLGGWRLWVSGSAPGKSLQYAFATQGGAYMIYQNAAWDFRAYNLDRDVKVADDSMGGRLNAVDPNLKSLRNRGGKLILYHGWNDPALAPMATVNYYQSVVSKMSQKETADFVRLYMVPGMQHCGGGPGPDSFGATPVAPRADSQHSMSTALESWVEQGTPPGKIIASKYAGDRAARTRPLCPYPQVARYSGTGSTDDAANFKCVDSK